MNDRDKPLLSLVMASYNAEQWIALTLDSFVNQTVGGFEVIVVDDCSSDATVAIAESYADRLDIRVEVLPQNTGGPSRPRNVGAELARGELIVCCDPDDLAAPERVEGVLRAWDAAGRQDCLIFTDHDEIDGDGNLLADNMLTAYPALLRQPTTPLADDAVLLSAEAAFDSLVYGCYLRPCAVAITRNVYRKIGGYDEQLGYSEDYDLYLRTSREVPFIWIKRNLGHYRTIVGNQSSRPSSYLIPFQLAVHKKVMALPLTPEQARKTRNMMASCYVALGYEASNTGELAKSLGHYLRAFRIRPSLDPLRGMLGSLAKKLVGGGRQ